MAELNLNTAEQLREQITVEQQKQIEAMYKKVSRQVAAQAKKAPRVPSDRLRQHYLNELQKQLDAQLKQISGELEGTIKDNMGRVSNSVCEANLHFLNQAGMPIAGAFSHVPDDVIRSIVTGQVYDGNWSLSQSIWRGTQKAQEDIRLIIAAGVAENKSAYDIAKDLEKYVNPTARKEWDWNKVYPGTAKKVDYNAQRLARTMVSHAYQQSFVQTTQKNPFVTEYIWLASNSDRTCDICAERDGKHFPKDDLPMDHPNGMCTFEAVIPDSMTDIADRLADWAQGKDDPQLDEWAKDLYGKGWEEKTKESADTIMQHAMDLEFKQIDAALERFLHSDGSKTLDEMFPELDFSAGAIEKSSVKSLIETYIKPFNDDLKTYGDGFLYWDPDQTISILYKDGRTISVSPQWWDGSEKIPTSNIDSVIVDSGWGTAVGGKNIRLYNTREEWEYGRYGYKDVKSRYLDFNDIRADFK